MKPRYRVPVASAGAGVFLLAVAAWVDSGNFGAFLAVLGLGCIIAFIMAGLLADEE